MIGGGAWWIVGQQPGKEDTLHMDGRKISEWSSDKRTVHAGCMVKCNVLINEDGAWMAAWQGVAQHRRIDVMATRHLRVK
jgi:hypothetical protein